MAETARPRLCTKETVKREGLNIWVDDEEVPSKTKIDIILVQGLGANPYYTWVGRDESQSKKTSSNSPLSKLKGRFGRDKAQKKTSESSEKAPEQSFFWPKELLPNHISPARIATYSYESKWWDKTFRTNLRTCGEQLLAVLHQHRQQASTRGRPIIFIGHSLGGLVVQQALVLASMNDMYIDIQSSVAGALFLGAPMQGATSIKYISLYINAAGNEQPMVTTLAAGSDELFALANDFRSRYKTLSMTCFYEQHDSRYGGVVSLLAVGMQSSTMAGLPRIYLPADHSHLNKFWGENDEKFQLFIPSVRAISEEIHRKMDEARTKESESQPPPQETPSNIRTFPERTQASTQVLTQGKIMVPFTRDKGFVGRADILQEIDEMLHFSEEQTRVALVGLGGIGKSQIAIEYAYRFRARFPDAMILWVYGTNVTRFRTSYTDIAKQLRLDGLKDSQDDPMDVLHRWLQSEESGRWFMILDNVDDRSFVTPNTDNDDTSKNDFSIPEFLPQRENSVVLITSRDGDAALDLVHQDSRFRITVQSMDKKDTRELLDKKLPKSNAKEEEKDTLIEKLDSIPLAITQAAAYLHKKTRVTLKQYLVLLDKSEHDPKSVLNIHGSDSRRDPKVTNAVFKTWQITLDLIKENHPDAAELLAVMSMFDRQGIPALLFQNEDESSESDSDGDESSGAVSGADESEQDDDNDTISLETVSNSSNPNSRTSAASLGSSKCCFNKFEDSIQILLSFCLLTEEQNGTSFQMHRLVQLATTNWLGASRLIQQHKDKAMRLLANAYPDGQVFENWTTCRVLEPHAEALLRSICITRKCRLARAQLYYNRVRFLIEQGPYSKAEDLASVALQERIDLLGEGHPDSLWAAKDLGWLYLKQSRFEMAEKHNLKYLAIAEDTYGKNDQLSMALLYTSNTVYLEQGHYEKAAEGCEKLVARATQVLGKHHRSTDLYSLGLAQVYNELKRHEEAVEILLPLSEYHSENRGKEHPDTMMTLQSLAQAYHGQGRFQEAEELEWDVLHANEKTLGEEHPDTLLSKVNLASTLADQGRLAEAEVLEVDVLRSHTRIHGEAHVETLQVMINLASTYKQLQKYSDAISLMIKAVRLSEEVLKSTHPHTKERTLSLQKDLSEVHAKGDQESQGLIIQAQEQMETAIETSHSTCLAECLYHVYFLRCLQLKNLKDRSPSAEDQNPVRTEMERFVVSALRLFVTDGCRNGKWGRIVGKILALAGWERDALTLFERIVVKFQATSGRLESQGSYSSDGSGDDSDDSDDSDDIEDSDEDVGSEEDDEVIKEYDIVRNDRVETGTTEHHTAAGWRGNLDEGTVRMEEPQDLLGEEKPALATQESRASSEGAEDHASTDGTGSDDFVATFAGEPEEHDDKHKNITSEDGNEVMKMAPDKDGEQDDETADESEEDVLVDVTTEHVKSGAWCDNAWCDCCKEVLHLPEIRYLCIECEYTDLCQSCFDRLQLKGSLDSDEMKDCKGHRFLSAPRPEWYDLPWDEVSEDGTTFTEWVDNLLVELQSRST